jgi:apolipoprotein N-acyltransferase
MKQKPSELVRQASVLFAWFCWGIAYWQSSFWWVLISFIPYILSNSYGHLLDDDSGNAQE